MKKILITLILGLCSFLSYSQDTCAVDLKFTDPLFCNTESPLNYTASALIQLVADDEVTVKDELYATYNTDGSLNTITNTANPPLILWDGDIDNIFAEFVVGEGVCHAVYTATYQCGTRVFETDTTWYAINNKPNTEYTFIKTLTSEGDTLVSVYENGVYTGEQWCIPAKLQVVHFSTVNAYDKIGCDSIQASIGGFELPAGVTLNSVDWEISTEVYRGGSSGETVNINTPSIYLETTTFLTQPDTACYRISAVMNFSDGSSVIAIRDEVCPKCEEDAVDYSLTQNGYTYISNDTIFFVDSTILTGTDGSISVAVDTSFEINKIVCEELQDSMYSYCNINDSLQWIVHIDSSYNADCELILNKDSISWGRCIDFCIPVARDTKLIVLNQMDIKLDLDTFATINSSYNPDELRFGLVSNNSESEVFIDNSGYLQINWDDEDFFSKDTLKIEWYAECKSTCEKDTALLQICRPVENCGLDLTVDGKILTFNGANNITGDYEVQLFNASDDVNSVLYATGDLYNPNFHLDLGASWILTPGTYNIIITDENGNEYCCNETFVVEDDCLCEEGIAMSQTTFTDGVGASPCFNISICPNTYFLDLLFTSFTVSDEITIEYNGDVWTTGQTSTNQFGQYFQVPIDYISGINEIEICVIPDPNTTENITSWDFSLGCCNEPIECPSEYNLPTFSHMTKIVSSCAEYYGPALIQPYVSVDLDTELYGWINGNVGSFVAQDTGCVTELIGSENCSGGGRYEYRQPFAQGPGCDRENVPMLPCFDDVGGMTVNVTPTVSSITFSNATSYNTFKSYLQTNFTDDYGLMGLIYKDATCGGDGSLYGNYFTINYAGNNVWSFDDVNFIATSDITPYTSNTCCEDFWLSLNGVLINGGLQPPNGITIYSMYNNWGLAPVIQGDGGNESGGDDNYVRDFLSSKIDGCGQQDLIITITGTYSTGEWEVWAGGVGTGTLLAEHDNFVPQGANCEGTMYIVDNTGANVLPSWDGSCDFTGYSFDLTFLGGGGAETFTDENAVRIRLSQLTGVTWFAYFRACGQFYTNDPSYNSIYTPITVTPF